LPGAAQNKINSGEINRRHFDSLARHIDAGHAGKGSLLQDMMRMIGRRRASFALGVAVVLTAGVARAENLDEGKSGGRLFTESCAACHHSARGLTKGRFRLTLYLFLQQHYATNSSSAWELASYLESVDDTPKGRSRAAAVRQPAASKSSSSLRPPMPIPQR
jgi:mono/diheme cytochrome c family protein